MLESCSRVPSFLHLSTYSPIYLLLKTSKLQDEVWPRQDYIISTKWSSDQSWENINTWEASLQNQRLFLGTNWTDRNQWNWVITPKNYVIWGELSWYFIHILNFFWVLWCLLNCISKTRLELLGTMGTSWLYFRNPWPLLSTLHQIVKKNVYTRTQTAGHWCRT